MKASTSPHSTWRPEKAIYGTASKNNIAIKGAGGTTIRVNEIYPTTARQAAKGKFPVVMTMTPYGKGSGGSSETGHRAEARRRQRHRRRQQLPGAARLHQRRRRRPRHRRLQRSAGGCSTRSSSATRFKVLHWAAHLQHSNGRVGTYGPSYLGIDQVLLAGAVGRHSPLKAIFPMVTANDTYRDTSFMGGLLDAEFSERLPRADRRAQHRQPVAGHRERPGAARRARDDRDGPCQRVGELPRGFHREDARGRTARRTTARTGRHALPASCCKRIVANHIPAFLVGGEFDIFQHGEPLNYAALQNAWARSRRQRADAAGPAGHRPLPADRRAVGAPQRLQRRRRPARARVVRHLAEAQAHRNGAHARRRCTTTTSAPGSSTRRRRTRSPEAKPTRFYFGARHSRCRRSGRRPARTSIAWLPVGQPVRAADRPVGDGRHLDPGPRRRA